MTDKNRKIILCSCEDTMVLAPDVVGAGCRNATLTTARHLCGAGLDHFRQQARDGHLTVACTQERPLFEQVAEDDALGAELTFVNVREMAGWSSEGSRAGPKMAALIAGAQEEIGPPPAVSFESSGVTLIYGSDQTAIDAAEQLKTKLDITVVLTPGSEILPPRVDEFPIRQGRIRTAKGHLGAFEITIDAYAEPLASSRARLAFGNPRAGAVSRADIVLDVSGGAPLFSAHDLRDGYLRADPRSPADVQRALFRAADLVGTFDKPRYVMFRPELCAHSRSRKVGCTRCLDLCPAGAIAPAGNHVAIDPHICGGCGQCAAACPTGAANYAVPSPDTLLRKLRTMLLAYRAAGGGGAQVLVHDGSHGADLIDAAARFGEGLPAETLPLSVNEVTQVGLETIAAAFAYGAASIQFLTRAKPRHDIAGLRQTLATAEALLTGLGYGKGVAGLIETDDPEALVAALRAAPRAPASAHPASFIPAGSKRDLMKLALRELHRAAPAPVPVIALPVGSPFGKVRVNVEGCTLCLSCVSVCPTQALGDAQDRPLLKFDESLCVQCGLCQATCPENVITLEPRLSFAAFDAEPVIIKQEEPFCCIGCGKPFGTRSTVERIVARLENKHWMFSGENRKRIDVVKMCENCRVEAVVNAGFDPFAGPARPAAKTSEDYIREREAAMLEKIERGDA